MYDSEAMTGLSEVEGVLQEAVEGKRLDLEETISLLSVRDPSTLEDLFCAAREVKEKNFGSSVFCYGFVYFSTHCRNDCSFCYYKRSNTDIARYRKTDEEIVALSSDLEDSGVHLVDLTMGEDPVIHRENGYHRLVEVVQKVNDSVDVPLMVSPGVMPQGSFRDLEQAGADWFACYQETHNRGLFRRLRPHQDYDERFSQKKWAMGSGMLAEEGIMIGVGESIEDRAWSIQTMRDLGVHQVRAMTYIPQQCGRTYGSTSTMLDELVTLAVMRLVHPDRLIPASLDIEGLNGLRPRLEAGANVITSIIPPNKGLAGVAQHELDIECGGRTVDQVSEVLDDLGVRMAPSCAYKDLIEDWKRSIAVGGG